MLLSAISKQTLILSSWVGWMLAFNLIVVVIAVPSSAQNSEATNWRYYLEYKYKQRVAERWRLSSRIRYQELISRENILLGQWNQLSIDAGAGFIPGSTVRVNGGLRFYYTWIRESESTWEIRLWQGANLFWPEIHGNWRRILLVHFLRLEERLQNTGGSDYRFALRGRYKLGTAFPINARDVREKVLYVPISVEVFANLFSEIDEVFLDQYRWAIGVGYRISGTWGVELRYSQHKTRDTKFNEFDVSSNLIEFSVNSTVRIVDLVRGQ
jgi:hypothetical protein